MSAASGAERPFSILVVDDSEDTAESLAQLLNLVGFSTHAVTSGKDALLDATINPPDVIILDIRMPVMDGYEFVRRLRARQGWENPYLIAITGCGLPADRQRSVEAGINLHLVKPADPVALVALLRDLQAKKAHAQATQSAVGMALHGE